LPTFQLDGGFFFLCQEARNNGARNLHGLTEIEPTNFRTHLYAHPPISQDHGQELHDGTESAKLHPRRLA
jgi:hypothetical protein